MRKLLAAAATLAVGSLGFGAPAWAGSPPATAHGTFAFTSDPQTVTSVAGGNTFLSEVGVLASSGDFQGVDTDVDQFVFHANGSFQGQGLETCDPCSLGGRSGTYVAVFNFTGSGDTYTGHLTFLSGTGGLSGIHGGGQFGGLVLEGTGSYSYQYVFG